MVSRMILLADIGNTRMKWSLWEGGVHTRTGAVAHEPTLFALNLDAQWRGIAAPERVLVSNVVGSKIADALYDWVQKRWQLHTEFARAQKQGHGVTNSYARPDRLGADRWLAMIAARRAIADTAVCVVDCGTAITADVFDAAGQHRGGLIAPGLTAMCGALTRDTAAIGAMQQDASTPEAWLATDTQSGVLAGTRLAAAAFVDRVLTDAQRNLNAPVSGIITGGDAPALLPLLRTPVRHEPYLVLDGLAVFAGSAS